MAKKATSGGSPKKVSSGSADKKKKIVKDSAEKHSQGSAQKHVKFAETKPRSVSPEEPTGAQEKVARSDLSSDGKRPVVRRKRQNPTLEKQAQIWSDENVDHLEPRELSEDLVEPVPEPVGAQLTEYDALLLHYNYQRDVMEYYWILLDEDILNPLKKQLAKDQRRNLELENRLRLTRISTKLQAATSSGESHSSLPPLSKSAVCFRIDSLQVILKDLLLLEKITGKWMNGVWESVYKKIISGLELEPMVTRLLELGMRMCAVWELPELKADPSVTSKSDKNPVSTKQQSSAASDPSVPSKSDRNRASTKQQHSAASEISGSNMACVSSSEKTDRIGTKSNKTDLETSSSEKSAPQVNTELNAGSDRINEKTQKFSGIYPQKEKRMKAGQDRTEGTEESESAKGSQSEPTSSSDRDIVGQIGRVSHQGPEETEICPETELLEIRELEKKTMEFHACVHESVVTFMELLKKMDNVLALRQHPAKEPKTGNLLNLPSSKQVLRLFKKFPPEYCGPQGNAEAT